GPEERERLHGALRALRPARGALEIRPGARVRIRAPRRRTDAQDALYAGCVATVEQEMEGVSEARFRAGTNDHYPGAELQRSFVRFFYYRLDEVEPLSP